MTINTFQENAAVSLLTEFMCHSKCCLQAVILDDGAASVRVAHGANIGHAQGVTGVGATQILKKQSERLNTCVCWMFLSVRISTAAYRPGEEHRGVIVLRVAVTRRVVLPLPLAEVTERHGCIRRHLGAPLLLVHHQQLHNCQADGVVDAGMAVEAGCHRHDGQEVGFEPSAVELSHGLVSHQHDLQVARSGNETPGPVVG